MASTYTVNLGIEKIATGEQSGTWGTTTNTNFDIIDQAINGAVAVTLASAGTSGSPNTLAITDGSTSDGRNKFIDFNDGGDLGATAYVQLTPNDAEKIVHIRNSLSGGRSVIIFQGTYNASNDFEVPNGKDVVLKFDGGGASATVTQVFEDLLVTAVAATTVDTTNIEVTNLKAKDGTAAGSIADSTGVVTIASSVLTTTDINGGSVDGVTLGTNSAVTEAQIDNININGNTISSTDTDGNVTITPDGTGSVAITKIDVAGGEIDGTAIGANSASTGAFTTLNATGGGALTGTWTDLGSVTTVDINGGTIDGVTIGGSSAGAGSFTTLTASGDVNFDSGTLFVDESTNRVGVGTTSPITPMHIQGSGGASGAGVNIAADEFFIDNNGSTGMTIGTSNTGTGFYAFADSDVALRGGIFYNHASDVMGLRAGSKTYMTLSSGGDVAFYEDTGSTEKFFWDASAESLSIGSPSADNVTIYSTDDVPRLEFEQGGTVYADIGHRGASASARQNIFEIATKQSEPMAFRTDNTERMRIDSDGNVGIGTDSPASLLDVRASTDAELRIGNNSDGTATLSLRNTGSSNGIISQSSGEMAFAIGASEAMRIDASQNLLVGKTSADNGATAGIEIQSDGQIYITKTGGNSLFLNRLNNDGDIARFYKDGTVVGNLGVYSSNRFYVSDNDGCGLHFNATLIRPCDSTGANNDNAIDLGASGTRFKDLYLSSSLNADAGTAVTGSTQTLGVFRAGGNGNDTYGAIEIGHSGSDRGLKISGGRGSAVGEGFLSIMDAAGTAVNAIRIVEGGDISFYEDTGTTAKFFWDASAEKVFLSGAVNNSTRPQLALDGGSGGADRSAGISGLASGTNATDLLFFTNADTDIPRERMRITSAGDVGIGTTSPASSAYSDSSNKYLDLKGSAINRGGVITLRTSDSSKEGYFANDGGEIVLASYTAHPVVIKTSNSEAMRINSSGNVGIGSTDPGGNVAFNGEVKLETRVTTDTGYTALGTSAGRLPSGTQIGTYNTFNSSSSLSGIGMLNNGPGGASMGSYIGALAAPSGYGSVTVIGQTSGSNSYVERMRIDDDGNVGIGTDSPDESLVVDGGIKIRGTNYLSFTNTSDQTYIRSPSSNTLAFGTNSTEAMRITSNSHLLVNTTSGATPSGNNTAYLVVQSDAGANSEGVYIRGDGGSGDLPFVVGDDSNVAQLNIYGDGDVENTNGAYGTISDARVKENITDAGSQWDDFKALRIRKYNLISKPDEPHIGVIAQELEEAGMAGLVKETRQDGMKSVKTSILYMKAIKALQEAMERIEALEAEVAALKGA